MRYFKAGTVCYLVIYEVLKGFQGDAMVKSPPAKAGDASDAGLISWLGRSPGVGNGNPLQFFLPGKLQGERSLAG